MPGIDQALDLDQVRSVGLHNEKSGLHAMCCGVLEANAVYQERRQQKVCLAANPHLMGLAAWVLFSRLSERRWKKQTGWYHAGQDEREFSTSLLWHMECFSLYAKREGY